MSDMSEEEGRIESQDEYMFALIEKGKDNKLQAQQGRSTNATINYHIDQPIYGQNSIKNMEIQTPKAYSSYNYFKQDQSQFYNNYNVKIQQQGTTSKEGQIEDNQEAIDKYVEQCRQKGILASSSSTLGILDLIIKDNPFISLQDIQKKFQSYRIMYKEDVVVKMLKIQGYKWKRLVLKGTVKNHALLMSERQTWAHNIDKLQSKGHQMYYLGEAMFSILQQKGKMWLKQRNAQIQTRFKSHQMVKVLMIQSINRIQYYEIINGRITVDDVFTVIEKWMKIRQLESGYEDFSEDEQGRGLKKYLIVENQEFKKEYERRLLANGEHISEMERSNIEILCLPPFSAYLNPTLIIFNVLRYEIREQKPRNICQIVDLLHKQINELKKDDFQHANRDHRMFLDRSINKIEFV